MSRHTPGPWKVHPHIGWCGKWNRAIDVGPSGLAVAQVIGAFEQEDPGDQAKANARLIASAPELLTWVKEFEHYLRLADDMPNVQNHLREIITRIEA